MPLADQDAIDDLLLDAARHGADIATRVPKPATAAALLTIALKTPCSPTTK